MGDDVGQPARIEGDDGCSAGVGLRRSLAEGLEPGGHGHRVSGAVEQPELLVIVQVAGVADGKAQRCSLRGGQLSEDDEFQAVQFQSIDSAPEVLQGVA